MEIPPGSFLCPLLSNYSLILIAYCFSVPAPKVCEVMTDKNVMETFDRKLLDTYVNLPKL